MIQMMLPDARRALLGLFTRLATIALIIGLGLYLDNLFNALLVLVTIFQFELAYRQYWLSKKQYEPVFAVYVFENASTTKEEAEIYLEIENIGFTPALHIVASRVLCHGKPLSPNLWSNDITILPHQYLAPHSQVPLAIINKDFYEERFNREKCIIEIAYFNINGELGTLKVLFNDLASVVLYDRRPPGFLLSIPYYIDMLRSRARISSTYPSP